MFLKENAIDNRHYFSPEIVEKIFQSCCNFQWNGSSQDFLIIDIVNESEGNDNDGDSGNSSDS